MLGHLLGHWRAFWAAQVLVGGLFVQRHGVVHSGGDALIGQALLQRFAIGHHHGVLGVDACTVGPLLDAGNDRLVEQLVVALTDFFALLHFPFKAFQLRQHDGALQGVHAPAHAHAGVHVALALAMDADFAHGLGQGVVVGEDGAAVAVAAQGLAGEKAGAADSAEVAALTTFVGSAKALGGVFNDGQVGVFGCDSVDGVHVGGLAVKAHRHDGLGFGRDLGLDEVGVYVARVGLDIHKHGLGAEQHDHLGRGHKGKGRGDDLVIGLDVQGHEAHQQGLGTAGHRDAVLRTREGREPVFQLFDFGTHYVLAMLQHRVDAGLDLRLERLVLSFEVDEGDGHGLVHRKRVLNLDGAHNQPFLHVFTHERTDAALNGCGHNVGIVKR